MIRHLVNIFSFSRTSKDARLATISDNASAEARKVKELLQKIKSIKEDIESATKKKREDVMPKVSEADVERATKKNFSQSNVSDEKKVELIAYFLKKRYKREVKTRVKLSGYANAPLYALEMSVERTSYKDDVPYVNITGGQSSSPIDVNRKFLEHYWNDRKRQHDYETGKETPFSNCLETYQKEDIASSESELLLKAEIEGIL